MTSDNNIIIFYQKTNEIKIEIREPRRKAPLCLMIEWSNKYRVA